jgi:LysR family transcriptional regulator, benzoate and cis,cis-muconate-responsive activator of ben and cat genes
MTPVRRPPYPHMDLRHLRYFIAVATERSFTRAAERLGLAQPPLSRQIRELEERFGLQLFDRDSRPVALTDAGRLMLDHAQRVLVSVEQLRRAMQNFATSGRRRYVIGFVGSTIFGTVPLLLRRFKESAPDLDVDLIEMSTVTQITALKEGRIDAGLGRLTFEDPAIRRSVIDRERLVAAIPVGHKLARAKSAISLAELTSDTMILYPSDPRPSYADQVLALFHDQDLTLANTREVRELQTALGLVAAHSGVCLVPASVRRLGRDDIRYRPINDVAAVSPIILSWRAGDTSDATMLLSRMSDKLARHASGK